MSSSSELAIWADGLSKSYRVRRTRTARYRTLQEDLMALPRRLTLALRRTDRRADRFWALDNVSFEVNQGEILGIIGPNGAGKSTLLKVLSRITDPTRGRAELYGRVGTLLEVGTGFHPELTGRENIYLSGAVLGMRRREIARRFDEIVEFAEVERFVETPVKHYSTGMYMRLAFSVAAHLDPELLFVDEVLAVGDAEFQRKCLGKMDEVASRGRTVLFVSHNMHAVERLCQRVLRLEKGVVRENTADVSGAIRRYLSAFTDEIAAQWVNQQNEYDNPWFRPVRFAVTDEEGKVVTGPIRNDQAVCVRIDGTVTELDPALIIGYAIYTDDGTLLYWSLQSDLEESEWPAIRIGSQTLVSQMPVRLLNEGDYRVELIGGLYYRTWLFEPGRNAPALRLSIRGGLSDSPLWVEKRPGVLAPNLHWHLTDSSRIEPPTGASAEGTRS